jgi:hypothetical protein
MKIVVASAGAGTVPASWACTSSAAFLVYVVMQGSGGGVEIGVKSTGASTGVSAPAFVVGGVANDTVTITFSPETSCFLTLETDNELATASIKLL